LIELAKTRDATLVLSYCCNVSFTLETSARRAFEAPFLKIVDDVVVTLH
jgi:hypothetical protein